MSEQEQNREFTKANISTEEKIKFLNFMILNIGDQLKLDMTSFGKNDDKYFENGKKIFYKILAASANFKDIDKITL